MAERSRPTIAATYPSRPEWATAGLLGSETSSDHLDRCATGIPDKVAVIDGARRFTYGELLREVQAVAAGLRAMGVGPGDVVTMELPNWWEAAVVHQAVSRLGAIINPVVPIYRERELGFILAQAQPAAVVIPQRFRAYDYVAMLERLGAKGPIPPVIVARPDGELPAGFVGLGAMAGDGHDITPVGRADDITLLLYTSGTTADPKGVLHSHQTLGYEVRSLIELFGLDDGDTVFMPSPLTHITGFLFGLLLPPMVGSSVVLLDIWEPGVAADLIEAEHCRFTMGATPFLHGLVEEYSRRGHSSSLRVFQCGGADVPPALVRRAQDVLGGQVARVYGSTEFPTLSCGQPGNDLTVCAETDGLPIGPVLYRLEDASDGIGELVVDGPERFLGYLDAELNEAAFTADGFFHTGDLASIDDQGAVTIRGRSKDIILRGGENISVKEVEDLLYSHPLVREVAVVAMPDPVMVERACAFVVAAPGAELTLEAIAAYLDGQGLAKQKFPERLELVDGLPVTASGKVQKYVLRENIRAILKRSEST